jgi:hypothetical protein
MSEQALPALPPAANAALLAGNRRLAVALVRQATGLDEREASALVARHRSRPPTLIARIANLDRATLKWAALAGTVGLALHVVLKLI